MKLAWLFLLPALAGCGSYYAVRVPYNLPDMPGAAAARQTLSAVYLRVETPRRPEGASESPLAGILGSGAGPELRPSELARGAAKALNRPGARICAWRVDKAGGEDAFAAALAPSGLLAVAPSAPSVSVRKEERSKVYYEIGRASWWGTVCKGV